MMRNEKLEIENFEPVFEILQDTLVINSKSYLPGILVFNLIQKLSALVIIRVENLDIELGSKNNDYIKIILNQTYERLDYHTKKSNCFMYLYICVFFRGLIFITVNKPSKRSAVMI